MEVVFNLLVDSDATAMLSVSKKKTDVSCCGCHLSYYSHKYTLVRVIGFRASYIALLHFDLKKIKK